MMFRQSVSVFYHINAASYQVPSHPDWKFRVYFWHLSGISLFEGYSNAHNEIVIVMRTNEKHLLAW